MEIRPIFEIKCPDCGAELLQVVGGGFVCSSGGCDYERGCFKESDVGDDKSHQWPSEKIEGYI